MSEEFRAEVQQFMLNNWNNYSDKNELARICEHYYIFGNYDINKSFIPLSPSKFRNIHCNVDEYVDIVKEIILEKEFDQ